MADPGFLRGGGANPMWGRQPIIWSKISWKLHEHEKILTRGGGVPGAPLRSANVQNSYSGAYSKYIYTAEQTFSGLLLIEVLVITLDWATQFL